MAAKKPRIIVSATSDLSTDQRVHRSCIALEKQGFDVMLVGRKLPGSPPVPDRPYRTHRFKLWFHKGPLFYASFNCRLFLFLLFSKANAFFSNDLDTLAANFLAAKIRRVFLAYDSHEYFTGVPELENRELVKGTWTAIERFIFPKLKTIITVNDSIAQLYNKEYGKNLIVIRNVPVKPSIKLRSKSELRKELMLPEDKKLIILQGSGINIQRGAEEAVEAMQYLDDVVLIVLGGGDVMPLLTEMVNALNLHHKIIFKPRMPYGEMMKYTASCELGLTLDKDTNLNYRYSLPNKIFDYINAGIPVLSSRLPELEKIINQYHIGTFIENHEPEHIAERIRFALSNVDDWKKNLHLAASELNWEEEEKKFPDIIHELR